MMPLVTRREFEQAGKDLVGARSAIDYYKKIQSRRLLNPDEEGEYYMYRRKAAEALNVIQAYRTVPYNRVGYTVR